MAPLNDLAQLLPHRPPFLLVDRVAEADLEAGLLVAERRVSAGDPLVCCGHLPQTLVVEALCQAAACLNGLGGLAGLAGGTSAQQHRGYLVAATDFKFPDVVKIGETLLLRVCRLGGLGRMQAMSAEATAVPAEPGGAARPVASGRLLFAVTMP